MRPNRAFQRAMHSLAHPISLGAIVLLLFNDHWLRWNHPSWLTGKLGDFAWLAFAPFIAALLLAWVIPARWKRQETYVGGLSLCRRPEHRADRPVVRARQDGAAGT